MRGAFFFDIDTLTIRKDSEGRYCLNDLHKAAGGERRHEPLNWRNTDSFKEMVAELEITGNPVVSKTGRTGGTFVCNELVYAYAMWVSAAFNLKVIRVFEEYATKGMVRKKKKQEFLLLHQGKKLEPMPAKNFFILRICRITQRIR